MDAITRHRLDLLGLAADDLGTKPLRERMDDLFRRFVDRLPVENLSNNQACKACPGDPESWPRPTDRMLREHSTCGLGGTSFSLAYALRDLLRGVGANAHCTLGRNLVTEEVHAAVVAYLEDGPLLYDPALLTTGPVPVRPGGVFRDALGTVSLEPRGGATLTVNLTQPDLPRRRAIYSIVPLPAPPHRYRQAWVASFYRGRVVPLRLARRVGDVIRRYSERPGRLEILTEHGREQHPLGPAPVEELHDLFGIRSDCLKEWFDAGGCGA